jgi:hypothetical protein
VGRLAAARRIGLLAVLVPVVAGGCVQSLLRPIEFRGVPHAAHIDYGLLGTAYVGGASPATPLLTTRLVGIRVSDDDGRHAARIRPDQVATWVAFANEVFRPAGIRIDFDPTDLTSLRSTVINRMRGPEQRDWEDAKRAADEVADRYPDRMVVFFRHGDRVNPTGRGLAWPDYNFVVMPGWPADRHCGHEHISALAHEIGHHLGLSHTFAGVFAELRGAELFLSWHRGDLNRFDGDDLEDTFPDPGIRTTECADVAKVQLAGQSVPLARRNIMSYYDERDSLTGEQIRRLRWFLRERKAYRMKLPKNNPRVALEADELELLSLQNGRCSQQEMDDFGPGNWSASNQLFCGSGAGQLSVTLQLPVARSGRQRLDLYLTRAPDFGVVEVLLDGRPIGRPYDAWAPSVLASGRLSLGERRLNRGRHQITFRVRSKNPASTAFNLGVDAIALVPVPG